MKIDPNFIRHFSGNLKQVFLYVTDRCNASCEHCLYKTTLGDRSIKLESAVQLLKLFRELGAKKLTLIGGEPTQYDIENNRADLWKLIETSFELGYEYIRLDTNGQFTQSLLNETALSIVNNLAFSLDGHTANQNDRLRGYGGYHVCVGNIKKAISLGYFTSVTTCVDRFNIYDLIPMVSFIDSIGVNEINLHPMFKMGIDRDHFTGSSHLSPEIWVKKYRILRELINKGNFRIDIRIPQRFVSLQKYKKHPEEYFYCPVRLGERVLVHPDGTIRICALTIGSKYHIAKYNSNGIQMALANNELNNISRTNFPCLQQKIKNPDLIPLCISYKPYQSEYVWNSTYEQLLSFC